MKRLITFIAALILISTMLINFAHAQLYTHVPVSDVGFGNGIGQAATTRNIVVDSNGSIYAVFQGSAGIRVAKSTDRGASFQPSVQVTGVNQEAEVAVSSNGSVHVVWSTGSTIYISSSMDGGLSFSNPFVVGTGYTPHITTYGANVYVLSRPGSPLYRNSNNGIGAFTTVNLGGAAYSDVLVDPTNGDVYVIKDSPTITLKKSVNNGISFTNIGLSPTPSVYYSSYTLSIGPLGKFIFVAGNNSTPGFRINLANGVTNSFGVGNMSGSSLGRTMVADEFGNLVDGYRSGSTVAYRLSTNQGSAFAAPVSVHPASSLNVFRNHFYGDLVVIYSYNNQVYCTVYGNLLAGLTTHPLASSVYCTGASLSLGFSATGTYATGNVFTAEMSDASGNFASQTILGALAASVSGNYSMNVTVPTNTATGTNYRFRIVASTPFTEGSDNGTDITILQDVGQEVNIQGNTEDIPDGDITPIIQDFTDFGIIQPNTSVQRTFVIQNTGTGNLTTSNVLITGSGAQYFSVTTAPSGSIAAGGNSSLIITYTPTAVGTHQPTVQITTNDCDESTYNFDIKGVADNNPPAGSLNFDGGNDHVNCINSIIPTGNGAAWTVSAWVNPDVVNNGNYHCVFSQHTSGTNGRFTVRQWNGGWAVNHGHSSGNINMNFGTAVANTWSHLTVTYDGTNIKGYLNGVLQATGAALSGGIINTNFRIGRRGTSNNNNFDGRIDEVRVWDYALCADEITATMNCELAGNETGLISYYKFNQGFVGSNNGGETTLLDATGNQNGTLNNLGLTGTSSNWDIQAPAVNGSCGALSCINTWTGNINSDWSNSGNWSSGVVPSSSSDAVIPTTPTGGVFPIVTNIAASVDNLDIELGAQLTVASGSGISVDAVLTNNGTITINNGGSLMQYDLSTLAGSGIYNVLRQGATGQKFNFWSSPITNQSGVPGTSYAYNPSTSTQDDTDDNPSDPGWSSYNGAMNPGTGYAGSGGGLVTFTGMVNNGNINEPLFYYPFDNTYTQTTAGTPFNLVGNPYPSALSASSLISENPDIDGTIYFWDDDLSGGTDYHRTDFAYWNGTGGLGTGAGSVGAPNGFISTAQGFYVRALNAGTLTFSNGQRVTGPNTQFFRMNGEDSRLWFSIETDSLFNQILIGALEDATEDEDRLYDAVKMRSSNGISLSAAANQIEHAIMAFPPPAANKTIPLRVSTEETGTHIFKAQTVENFSEFALY